MKRNENREMRGGVPKRRPGILNKPGRISLGRRTISNVDLKKGTHNETL